MEMGLWEETFDRWHGEGLPRWVNDIHQLHDHLGLDKSFNRDWLQVNYRFHPTPEETVSVGEGGIETVRSDIGLVLRRTRTMRSIPMYLEYPVKDAGDYERVKHRIDGSDPGRYPEGLEGEVRSRRVRGEAVGANMVGFFAIARELMGLEAACVGFIENPGLMARIVADRVEFAKAVYDRAFGMGGIDYVQIWEDMAYKTAPLISPGTVRAFFLEGYREIVRYYRSKGVELIMMDSDGHMEGLIPIITESGMDGMYPCEIAAGTDPVDLRARYPDLALIGGVDKRALSSGGREGAASEIRRLLPAIRKGRYIPCIDHFVPPDISYDTFRYYLEMKAKALANPYAAI